jgi:hypothetical protein
MNRKAFILAILVILSKCHGLLPRVEMRQVDGDLAHGDAWGTKDQRHAACACVWQPTGIATDQGRRACCRRFVSLTIG